MLINRAYRHKARFTVEQENLAARFAGCARLIYNSGLEQRRLGYRVTGKGMSYQRQTYFLKDAKADPNFEFLREAPAHVLQQALRDLDKAYKNFFAGRAGLPKFRRRGETDSFRYPDTDPKQIGTGDPGRQNQIRLPKLGWVSLANCYPRLARSHNLHNGELKSVTVSREADGWYVSLTCAVEVPHPAAPAGEPVGLDLGVACSVALSTGEMVSLPRTTDRELEKPAILQRRLERKRNRSKDGARKRSRNRDKAKAKLARERRRIACPKRDAIHKLTTRLATEHPLIGVEDLRVKSMTASAKGTVEQPGVNVAQKSGLNRAILDQCWGELRRQLQYKTLWRGGECLAVNAAYSSQECSECHHVASESRESQAVFRCLACGHEQNADVNAACVMRWRALAVVAARGLDADEVAASASATPAVSSVRTAGTAEPGHQRPNACLHVRAPKNPERGRPSRKVGS